MFRSLLALLSAISVFSSRALVANAQQPVVAAGYAAQVVSSNVTKARGIVFDSQGHLLVVLSNSGIVRLDLADQGGTNVTVTQTHVVVNDTSVWHSPKIPGHRLLTLCAMKLNHGIELSPDGKTLYASSTGSVYSWSYDPSGASATGKKVVVQGMSAGGHATRTLLLSRKIPGSILVSHGSDGNLDVAALDITTGHSQIRAFNLSGVPNGGWDYSSQGTRVGWGLRNSVGVGEHPVTGGIYSVENSADQIQREGVDISNDNPGEEMNYHGTLNSSSLGGNYGYPTCYTAWGVNDIPDKGNLTVGAQFVLGTPNATLNDTYCARERIPPRLAFQAHQAPLDIKFNDSGKEAWVTFHGSWDRKVPVGYKLSVIPFANGEPVARSDNSTAAIDIVSNSDLTKCPNSCFRPVGLAFDKQGRLYMSSDAPGEIFIVDKLKVTETSGNQPSGVFITPTVSHTGSASSLSWPQLFWFTALVGFAGLLA